MRHITMLLLCLIAMSAKAQRLTHDFQGASLSEALIWIDNAQDSYKLNFIFDELEDFTVTTSLKNVSVRDAVRQVCGFYPMHLTFDEQDIYIECIQKETQKVIGRVINEQGQPVEFANVALLLPAFVIPCRPGHMLIRVSFVGYKTHYQPCTVGEVGNIRLRRDAIVLKNVVVKGEIPQYKATRGGMTVEIQNSILKDVGTADDATSYRGERR